MAEYTVTCGKCGENFDAKAEGYYNRKTRKFVCPACEDKLKDFGSRRGYLWKAAADMLLKLYFGVFLLRLPEGLTKEDAGAVRFYLLFGLVLVGWAVYAFVKAMKAKKIVPDLAELLLKLATAALSFGVSFDLLGEGSMKGALIEAAFGCAIALWGLIPYLREKKREREWERLVPAVLGTDDNAVRLCPYCGAASRGRRCGSCGSAF